MQATKEQTLSQKLSVKHLQQTINIWSSNDFIICISLSRFKYLTVFDESMMKVCWHLYFWAFFFLARRNRSNRRIFRTNKTTPVTSEKVAGDNFSWEMWDGEWGGWLTEPCSEKWEEFQGHNHPFLDDRTWRRRLYEQAGSVLYSNWRKTQYKCHRYC